MKGHQKTSWYLDFATELHAEVEIALANVDPELRKEVVRDMRSTINKTSSDELKQQIERWEKGINKKRTIGKSEDNPNGIHVTAEMGGMIQLGILHKGKGHDEHVHEEIEARGIKPPKPLSDMEWGDVKNLLRVHEYQVLVEQELARNIEHWSNVSEIKPQSEKLMELFDYQADYFLQKQARQKSL